MILMPYFFHLQKDGILSPFRKELLDINSPFPFLLSNHFSSPPPAVKIDWLSHCCLHDLY